MAGQRLTAKSSLNNHTGSGDLYMGVDVSDTTGSAAGTSKKLDSKYVIQTDKISVSNAELQAMDASGGAGTFKTLVSAAGSGYAILPLSATIVVTYGASTESSNKNLFIGYDNTQQFAYWESMSRFMGTVTTSPVYILSADPGLSGSNGASIDNLPLYLYSSGNFNGGWSADVYITYHIIKLG